MWSLSQSIHMAYWRVMWLRIWVLQPWPQLRNCQGSWCAFSRQKATIQLILMWLFLWQWHSHWKPYVYAWAMLAHPTVAGSPQSLLVTLEETREYCCLSPDTLAEHFHLVELPVANTPPTCLQHTSGFHGWGYSCSKVCPSLSISYLTLGLTLWSRFTEESFGLHSLQINKKKTVFIKEILETATSAVFGLLWNYILARKHVLVKESTPQLKTPRQHNGTSPKAAGTVIPAK